MLQISRLVVLTSCPGQPQNAKCLRESRTNHVFVRVRHVYRFSKHFREPQLAARLRNNVYLGVHGAPEVPVPNAPQMVSRRPTVDRVAEKPFLTEQDGIWEVVAPRKPNGEWVGRRIMRRKRKNIANSLKTLKTGSIWKGSPISRRWHKHSCLVHHRHHTDFRLLGTRGFLPHATCQCGCLKPCIQTRHVYIIYIYTYVYVIQIYIYIYIIVALANTSKVPDVAEDTAGRYSGSSISIPIEDMPPGFAGQHEF